MKVLQKLRYQHHICYHAADFYIFASLYEVNQKEIQISDFHTQFVPDTSKQQLIIIHLPPILMCL